MEAQHSPDGPAPTAPRVPNGPEAGTPTEGHGCSARGAVGSLRELHLFAGAGGGILGGLLLGHTPVCAVEIDAYCRKVLEARQRDGCLPQFPIYEDVRQFDGRPWHGRVDVVAGGFPCQPWSQAGKRKGADDPRHLWPEMARIVEEVRPTYVFAENVSLAALEEPWRDLRGLGYRVPPALCVAASDVGAPHIRKRWWLLAADAKNHGRDCDARPDMQPQVGSRPNAGGVDADGHHMDDSSGGRHRIPERQIRAGRDGTQLSSWWQTEPAVGRVADGLAHRVDRLRALGNGQVPMAAATAWHHLIQQI